MPIAAKKRSRGSGQNTLAILADGDAPAYSGCPTVAKKIRKLTGEKTSRRVFGPLGAKACDDCILIFTQESSRVSIVAVKEKEKEKISYDFKCKLPSSRR